jgi:hypothetical protein
MATAVRRIWELKIWDQHVIWRHHDDGGELFAGSVRPGSRGAAARGVCSSALRPDGSLGMDSLLDAPDHDFPW